MKLLLIDGANFMHRARAGFQEGPHPLMFNFFRNLRALIGQHNPDRVIYVLEGHPKARHEESADYKANRRIDESLPENEKKVDEMKRLFEGYSDILELMMKTFPVTVVRHPDHECDDVVHNLAKEAAYAIGAPVRMSEELKRKLRGKCGEAGKHVGPFDPGEGDDPGGDCWGCSSEHVDEFGESVGIVIGPTDYNNCKPGEEGYDPSKVGPELDVRWPGNIRFAYAMHDLVPLNEVVIASSDTDFIQSLALPGVSLWNMGKKEFTERPSYDYAQWKALKGDATDNIKGIPGVGEKTATRLVTDPERFASFLSDPEKARVYERNIRLIRFHDFSDEEWLCLSSHRGVADWDEAKRVFDSYGFKSITNDKSWKKFTETFMKANSDRREG
jgi:5'-3' exonuclease